MEVIDGANVSPQLEVHLSSADLGARVLAEVAEGLTGDHASLPLERLTDSRTHELWAELEASETYYQARCERGLVAARAPDALGASKADTVVMLGATTGGAIDVLLDTAHELGSLRRFIAVADIEPAVDEACRRASARYPGVDVRGIVADPTDQFAHVPLDGPCLVVVSGPTIGHLRRRDQARFLASLARHLDPDDSVLIAADLAKDHKRLVAAYDDPQGVQAARSRNALVVLARELDAVVDPDGWHHVALWNAQDQSIEVALQADGDQVIAIESLAIERYFDDGELLELERNTVFMRSGFDTQLALAGLDVNHWWTDPKGDFALTLASV